MTPDGIYHDMPESVYRADPALSYSRIKLATRTLAEYRYAVDNPKPPTNAMIVGTLTDRLVFGFDLMEGCEIKPEPRAPAGWRESVIAAGKTPVTSDLLETAKGCAASIKAHRGAMHLLKGRYGVSMFLTLQSGVRVKCRADCISDSVSDCIVDLKKCQDASPARDGRHPDWAYKSQDLGYHIQAGLYLHVWNALAGTENPRTKWAHVLVEEDPPNLVAVKQMSDAAIDAGRELAFRLIERITEAEKTGKWPGYPNDVEVFELPR